MTLNDIGLEYQTDKSTITHHYLDNYEKYFSAWRDRPLTLLEIGVAGGASIRMWREYFPNAKVYGIDNNPDCAGDGIFIGSQDNLGFLDNVICETGPPDIIIDDGSHHGPKTIETFRHLFPKMAAGGWYVVEDTHCFYDPHYGEAPPYGQGMSAVFNFFSGLTAHVDVMGRGMCGNAQFAIDHPTEVPPVPRYSRLLESMHIHPSLWFFKRK